MNIISSNNNRKLPVVTLKQLSTTTNQQQQQQQSSIDATINKIATSSSSSIMDDYDESRILKSLSDETKHQPQQQSIQNGCILDDSLTSLTWLQNLNLLKANNAKNNTTNNNSTNSSVIASTAVNDSTINNKNMNSESTPTLASKTSTTTTTTCVTEFPVVMNDTTSTQSSNSFALIGISYPPLSPPLSVQCSPNSTNSSSNHSTKTTTTLNTNMTAINTPNKFAKTAIGTAAKSNNGKSGYSRANSGNTTVKKIKQAVLSSSVSSKKAGEAISTNQSTTSSPSAAFHSDSNAKPPYSYSQLIVLSMRESRASKMTLQMIYDWIIDNFGYFRKADPNWQVTFKNSIRHNLSLNKCFKKIARQKDEPGKGGFWTLDEEYKKQLLCNERSPTTSSVVVGESAANESDAVATNTTSSTSTTTTSTTKDGQLPSTMQSLKRRRKSPKSENPRQPKSTIRKMDEQKSSGSGTSKAKKLKTAALKHSMSVPDGKQSTPSSSETSTNSTLEANNSYLAPFSTNASNTNTNNISSLQLQQNSSWQQQHTHQHHHNHQHHPSCHQSSFTCSCGGMNGGYSTYNSYYGQQQTSTPSYNRSMTCCTSMPSSSTNLYHSHHHHNPQNHHPHMVDDLSNTFSSSFGHEIIKSMDDDVEATAAGLFNFEQALECNFDLDPLTSSQAPVQSTVGTHIPTNDMSNHHHIHNQHHSSMPPSVHPLNRFQHQSTTQQQTVDTHQNTTTTADVELNELFEYTSQFSTSMNQQNGVSQNNGGDYLSYLSTPNAYDMLGGEANSQGGSTTSSSGAESPLDQVSKARLDLTIQGHGIKQPKWWMDSLITSGNNDPLNNSHSQSASSTTSFHFIDLDNNITGSDLLGMPSKRDAADECDSASMFINTASLCYDVGNQAAVTSTGDKELLSSSLAAAVDGKDII